MHRPAGGARGLACAAAGAVLHRRCSGSV